MGNDPDMGGDAGGAGTSRLPNLDALRGLAALAVVSSHAYGLGPRDLPFVVERFTDLLLKPGGYGVYLFFIISGAVISRRYVHALLDGTPFPDTINYAVRRVLRIYPLYLVALAVFLVVLGPGGLGIKRTLATVALLQNLLPGSQAALIGVAWTLSIEVLFYLSVPILAMLHRRVAGSGPVRAEALARAVLAIGAMALTVTLVGVLLAPTSSRYGDFLRISLPGMYWAFVPGILLVIERATTDDGAVLRGIRSIRHGRTLPRVILVSASALGFVCAGAQDEWGLRTLIATHDASRLLWTIAFAVLVIRAVDRPEIEARHPRLARWMGDLSYGVYLIHGLLLSVLLRDGGTRFVPLSGSDSFVAYVVHVAFLLALTVPVAVVGFRLIETPMNDLARRICASRSGDAPVAATPSRR